MCADCHAIKVPAVISQESFQTDFQVTHFGGLRGGQREPAQLLGPGFAHISAAATVFGTEPIDIRLQGGLAFERRPQGVPGGGLVADLCEPCANLLGRFATWFTPGAMGHVGCYPGEVEVQIILVHSGLKQARTLTLSTRHLVLAVAVVLTVLLFGSSALSYATLRFGAVLDLPILRDVVRAASLEIAEKRDGQLRDHLNAMAIRLGEMQAQMSRLNVIGERVTSLVGIKPQDFGFGSTPGRGGAVPGADARDMTLGQLKGDLASFEENVSNRTQDMNRLESALLDQRVAKRLMPTSQPVNDGFVGSGFGWRTDPFTGKQTRHDGIDFSAPTGTPILAAAGGVVVAAEFHPEFGNMVDVDHGNGVITRYAHASRLLVKAGDIVKRGQHLADVGSTGRSTGSHLHFEVHVNGTPQNPSRFLADGGLRQLVTASK